MLARTPWPGHIGPAGRPFVIGAVAIVQACSGNYRGSDGGSDASLQDGGASEGGGTPCDAMSGGACDLADPMSCGGAQGCVPSASSSSYCRAVGTKQQGDVCTGYACAPGYTCYLVIVNPIDCSQNNCACVRWCVYPCGACPAGTSCQSPVKYNGQSYGTCR